MNKESITDPEGKIYTKEDFQQLLNGNIFRGRGNVETTHMFRIYGWKIPSLAGFILPQLFARGLGPIHKPNEHNMNHLDEYCKLMQCGGISITRCKVKVLGNVNFPEFVGTIDLSHNKIKNLRGVVFGCCASIVLKNNKIESLDGCVFPEGVVEIYLDHNRIKSLKGVKFPSTLKRFSISSNPLESLDDCVFPEGVVGIHLDHNRIKSLEGVKFPSTLKRFSISSNPLITLDGIPSKFLDQVKSSIEHERQYPELYRKSRLYGFPRKDDDDYQPPQIVSPEPSAPLLDPNDQSDLLPHYNPRLYDRLTYEPSSFNNYTPPPAPTPPTPPPPVTNASEERFYDENFATHPWDAPLPNKDFSELEFGGPFFGGSRRKKNKKRKLTRKQTRKPSRKLKRKTRTLRQRLVKKTRLYKNKNKK